MTSTAFVIDNFVDQDCMISLDRLNVNSSCYLPTT